MTSLKTQVEEAEGNRGEDHVFEEVEALRSQLASQTQSTVPGSDLQAQIQAAQSSTSALHKQTSKVSRDLTSVQTRLQVTEGSKTRLDSKTNELQRLIEDVTVRKNTMRRVELLRNVQLVWSRRVLLRLTELWSRWSSAR